MGVEAAASPLLKNTTRLREYTPPRHARLRSSIFFAYRFLSHRQAFRDTRGTESSPVATKIPANAEFSVTGTIRACLYWKGVGHTVNPPDGYVGERREHEKVDMACGSPRPVPGGWSSCGDDGLRRGPPESAGHVLKRQQGWHSRCGGNLQLRDIPAER